MARLIVEFNPETKQIAVKADVSPGTAGWMLRRALAILDSQPPPELEAGPGVAVPGPVMVNELLRAKNNGASRG